MRLIRIVAGIRIKSESNDTLGTPSELLVPACSTPNDRRDPSPFGLPSMLLPQDGSSSAKLSSATSPPVPADCSHDILRGGIPVPPARSVGEAALLGEGDWGMGDDEIEFVDDKDEKLPADDSNSTDIDLTLDDDVTAEREEGLVESCPICERELVGMSAVVRPTAMNTWQEPTQPIGHS